MGETLAPIKASFNNSLQIEGRPERLSAESGALLLREADERLGLSRDLAEQLEDPRAKGSVRQSSPLTSSFTPFNCSAITNPLLANADASV